MYNKNQPQIAQWNLAKLATAIYPLIGQVEPLQNAIGFFNQYYHGGWQTMMAEKLGLAAYKPGKEDFAKKRPDWARSKPGCSMLSCSS